ncbi:hypothetical protein BV20DRAFT_819990 [Pilatotrama ljubarskyi]|nr:hypothetical protein BV20DRAFT_819990 [Pilatotrama ljubarskyi]
MSSNMTTPTLFGVLIVLNIILAVVWIPVLDAVDYATLVFRAVSFVNAFTTIWWIWVNTSLRRRIRTASSYAIPCTRCLGFLFLPVLNVPLRLFYAITSAVCGACSLFSNVPRWDKTRITISRRIGTLRLQAQRLRVFGRARGRWSCPASSEGTSPLSIREILQGYFINGDRRKPPRTASPPPPTRCSSLDALVEEGQPHVDERLDRVHTSTPTPTSHKKFALDAPPAVTTLAPYLQRGRPSDPSHVHSFATYPCIRSLSPRTNAHIPDSPPSLASLSDVQSFEATQLYRDVRTLTCERDMYRARAYQLAMRLDECYSARAQDALDLDRVQGEVAEARRAIHVLVAERRGLSVALAAIFTPGHSTTISSLPDVEGESIQHAPSAEELVLYPRTPGTRQCTIADERPLLLIPAAETIEDTPTRSRTTTWTSAERSKSHLEDVLLETQRLSDVHSRRQGESALWDAQRVASARPLFSVVHQEIAGDRLESVEPPQVEIKSDADRIIEDLRMSRLQCATPRKELPVVLEQVAEEDEQEGSGEAEERKLEEPSIQVQVTRQPRGPPPSPFATRSGKAALAGQKGKEYTWRWRSKQAASPIPAGHDSSQPYPDSRKFNRFRTRQATAPATPATPSPSSTAPNGGEQVGRAGPSKGVVGEERRRHATFNGGGPTASMTGAQQGVRWPMSAFGNGGIERLRTPAQPYPFVPSNLFYQRTGGWPMK